MYYYASHHLLFWGCPGAVAWPSCGKMLSRKHGQAQTYYKQSTGKVPSRASSDRAYSEESIEQEGTSEWVKAGWNR